MTHWSVSNQNVSIKNKNNKWLQTGALRFYCARFMEIAVLFSLQSSLISLIIFNVLRE